MGGLTTEISMMMERKIGNKEVVDLIDSEATTNFISENLAPKLGLASTESFGVRVKNGHVFNGGGKCSGVYWKFRVLR